MTKEELQAIESRMSQEEIIERAKTLRPVEKFIGKGGGLFWLKVANISTSTFLLKMRRIKRASNLIELGNVVTYHKYGHPILFKPSLDECIYQCPYPEATACKITEFWGVDTELNRHVAETVYFSGEIPEDIKNITLKW